MQLTKEGILEFLKLNRQEFGARFTVTRIGLFGSFLHGSANTESDVDILVELTEPTFDHYEAVCARILKQLCREHRRSAEGGVGGGRGRDER